MGNHVLPLARSSSVLASCTHDQVISLLLNSGCCVCRHVTPPQQDNSNDCGVFALLIASQLGVSAGLRQIRPEHTRQYRAYITWCLAQNQVPGVIQPLGHHAGMSLNPA